jgi:hypothetical protein
MRPLNEWQLPITDVTLTRDENTPQTELATSTNILSNSCIGSSALNCGDLGRT